MGKNTRRQIQCKDLFHNVDVNADSVEEVDFLDWLVEAANLGIIKDFEYQPQSIKLSQSIEYVTYDNKKRVLMREHVYSPDFMISFAPDASRMLCKEFKLSLQQSQLDEFQTYLDVKGTFLRNDGGRAFAINQKWVYQKTGIYVIKLVPRDFFKVCGCPKTCFFTRKTNKKRTSFSGFPTIEEAFAEELKNRKAAN